MVGSTDVRQIDPECIDHDVRRARRTQTFGVVSSDPHIISEKPTVQSPIQPRQYAMPNMLGNFIVGDIGLSIAGIGVLFIPLGLWGLWTAEDEKDPELKKKRRRNSAFMVLIGIACLVIVFFLFRYLYRQKTVTESSQPTQTQAPIINPRN